MYLDRNVDALESRLRKPRARLEASGPLERDVRQRRMCRGAVDQRAPVADRYVLVLRDQLHLQLKRA